MKKNVLLADCKASEIASLSDILRYNNQKYETKSYIANWKRTGIVSELKRYGMYFYVGLRYFIKRRNYEALVGWQQFYALIFCFFCAVFRVKKTTFVVALNYTYKEKKGKLAKIYFWFMKKCMSREYLDYIHVPSEKYAEIIVSTFDFPLERIIVSEFGVNDNWETFSKLPPPAGYPKDGYALSIGRSNRDFDFLIRAWKQIEYPLVIISDTYTGNSDSENVVILRNVAGEESYPWIANCSVMVIPIDDGSICSGDTVLLTAMAVKRKLVVTVPSTLSEMYIVDGENALLTPKEESTFCSVVMSALNAECNQDLGERARRSFLENYSRQSLAKKIARMINT